MALIKNSGYQMDITTELNFLGLMFLFFGQYIFSILFLSSSLNFVILGLDRKETCKIQNRVIKHGLPKDPNTLISSIICQVWKKCQV